MQKKERFFDGDTFEHKGHTYRVAGTRRGYMKTAIIDDADITIARAAHPLGAVLSFERVSQGRRTYYRLLYDGRSSGSMTDAPHARETIAYWRERGWLTD